jgi:CBS domain containing-hemolysin-like protein
MSSVLLIVIMLMFSAFFSGMEIAFISSNRLRIELDKKQGVFSSRLISVFLNHPGTFLATMLIGSNIALVVYSILMAKLLEPGIETYFSSPVAVLLIQTIISTLIVLITAEFLPKIVFRTVPNLTLNLFSFPGAVFFYLLYPVSWLVVAFSELIIKRMHNNEGQEYHAKQVFNKIDLTHLIDHAQKKESEGFATDNDLKLFQNALDFSSVKVRDCMVPRTEIIALDISTPIEEFLQKFIETGFSKILIFKDNIDNMLGYITSKILFRNVKSINDKLIEMPFVPETMSANRLLEKFIKEKRNVAIVVDEFGGVSGMVTIEDLIEEIFGEIEDEHDTPELIEKRINESEYILSGRLEIDYLNEKYKLKIPESEDYETLAGFIFQHYESIPKPNAQIRVSPFNFKILKVTKTKIDLVQLKIVKE